MEDPQRPNPDALLAAIQKEEAQQKRGKLKVFFGMAAGAGKTYAMLEAARKEKTSGVDVVIGYLETHGRKETDALAVGLLMIPRKQIEHREILVSELDLDAVLARKPQLAIIDELAHTNAPGSRHPKRYHDILEILDAGINVFTTVNVQHVESRADTVREITGATIHETVPDSVLDGAEIELIDISPEDLIARLDEGKIYIPDRAMVAMVNFFREGNLRALREMALRLTAERVGHDVRDYMQTMQIAGPWKSGHRLLVAVSASPSSAQMVRWTRRLADSLDAPWIALHVETSKILSDDAQTRLTKNLSLARELGADVITTVGENLVEAVLRISRQHNVTQIVVGKPRGSRLRTFIFHPSRSSFLEKLVRESGAIDVHIVRGDKGDARESPARDDQRTSVNWRQYGIALGTIIAVTLFGTLIDQFIGYQTIGMVYLLAVVGASLFIGRGPIILSATLSALAWNYFFLPPRYTLRITRLDDLMMFSTYFAVALVLGQLVARTRAREEAERRREERATALYILTRDLAQTNGVDEIVAKLVKQIDEAFHAEGAVILPKTIGDKAPEPHPASAFAVSEKEQSVAAWVFQNGRAAGRFTDNLPSSEALYLPLSTTTEVLGVMGIRFRATKALTTDQRNLLEAFARQATLVMDRQNLRSAGENARLLAASEQLHRTLLDCISHELKTPLAVISTATESLAQRRFKDDETAQNRMLAEIRVATARLSRVVKNLLDMNRLESGLVKPHRDWVHVPELIDSAIHQLEDQLEGRPVEISVPHDLPSAEIDFGLIEQALANLILNAATYAGDDTPIEISANIAGDYLTMTVRDHGQGIKPMDQERIFEKFYRTPGSPTGGVGLGLSIVKGFVAAHGGDVTVSNHPDGGARFVIRLPLENTQVAHRTEAA